MKPTQLTELFCNIRKTFVSFFSILMFVALGVGIFLGISWSGPALQNAADSSFNEGSFHHFQIQFPYGLTEDDLASLSSVEGVTDVEGLRQSFQVVNTPGAANSTVKVQGLTERIDIPQLDEGRLPERVGEVALNSVAAAKLGYGIGDEVSFRRDGSSDAPTLDQLTSSGGDGKSDAHDEDGMKYLNASTFTVVGLVRSPEYLAQDSATYGLSTMPSGAVDLVAWVTPDTFDASAFQGGYPIVDVACAVLAGRGTFSSDYAAKSAEIEARITELGNGLAKARYDDLHGEGEGRIGEAQAKLDEGKRQIADGEKQLADGRAELETKRAEAQKQLESALGQLQAGEELKRQGAEQLAQGRALVNEGAQAITFIDGAKDLASSTVAEARAFEANKLAELLAGKITKKEYDAALDEYGATLRLTFEGYAEALAIDIPVINHSNFDTALSIVERAIASIEDIPVTFQGQTMTVAEARAKLADAQEQLAVAEEEYRVRTTQLEEGWAQYRAGEEELARLVAEGERKIAEAEAQLADAKAQVAENEPKLEQAKAQLASMKDYVWTVMSRSYNAGTAEIETFSNVTGNLSFSMAALFIIVGLLVSYSAVGRIVHEQVTQIGTKKALGLRSSEITASFLAYSAIAVLVGALIGAMVGVILVEGIIGHVLGGMFIFGDYPPYFGVALFLVVLLLELVLVLAATWFACRGVLKEHAIELLKGEKPPTGRTRFYEKWHLWDKLPLFTQTIVNNCVNDRRRVFSTVVGVAGCTALIVTAITLNNDVLKSYDAHYADVYHFNAIAYVDPAADGALDAVEETLANRGSTVSPVLRKTYVLTQPNGKRGTVRLIVPESQEALARVYALNPVSNAALDLSGKGVWVTQAYAEHFGAKVGDTLVFDDADGVRHEAPILGFYEFWLTYHEMVMGRDYYESEFGQDLEPNVVLADTHGTDVKDLQAELMGIEGFDSIVDDKIYQYGNFNTFSSVSSAVVAIYVALSVLMAIVVLLNLNVMFIEEKKRDLIVLMINGFSVRDAKRYIYNDTIVLTAIGIVFGLVLGCAAGSITVGAIEPSTASFIKAIDWPAVLIGAAGSALLALIMNVISLRRIPKFDLTDINRF